MNARRAWLCGAWLLFASASGCSYDGNAMTPVIGLNTCATSADCTGGAMCTNGMCIAQKADTPLSIALQITPPRNAEGEEALPNLTKPIMIEGPTELSFSLRAPIAVKGFVRAGGDPIEAEVTFTPTLAVRGIERKTITRNVTPSVRTTGEEDFEIALLDGLEYRMTVRPKDRNLPPQFMTMVASKDESPAVDYPAAADLSMLPSRKVRITNEDEDDAERTFLVRALNPLTGETISSTATMVAGLAELRFATEPESFSIEVRAEQTSKDDTKQVLENGYCDNDTPAFPVFTAHADELKAGSDGALLVSIPKLPSRIRFVGSVKLCEAGANEMITSLPVSLHARSLALPEGQPLTATFDATTTAAFDPSTKELQFCVQVIPGDYDVVATPVSSMPCGVFSEARTIAAPAGAESATSMLLSLPSSAYLSGTLMTMDAMPLRSASIDAIAIAGGARSRPSATDDDGSFEVQVDLGTYDVVVKPAGASGLPWQVRYAVRIASAMAFPTDIAMELPVTLRGSLHYGNSNSPDTSLAQSVVAGFVMVKDTTGERAVPIGSAIADAEGRFTLLLPPSIQSGWLPPIK